MTTRTNADGDFLSARAAHMERTTLVQQADLLLLWDRRTTTTKKRTTELTPLATVFDNKEVIALTRESYRHRGGVLLVVSGNGPEERNALLEWLGRLPATRLPVLLVVKDQKDEIYYRSLDPSGKDLRIVGNVSKYIASIAGILNSVGDPPPTTSIKREFARLLKSAQLLENEGEEEPSSCRGLFGPLSSRKRSPPKTPL